MCSLVDTSYIITVTLQPGTYLEWVVQVKGHQIPRKNLFSGFQLTLGWSVCLVIGHNKLSVIQSSRFILNLIEYLIKSFNCFREIVDTSKDARESIKLI